MRAPSRGLPGLLLASMMLSSAAASDCSLAPYCKDMQSCQEADHYFRQCGVERLDGDHDGIPCERLCGKSKAVYEMRRKGAQGMLPFSGGNGRSSQFKCGGKRYCREMASCREALFYLQKCGLTRLDGNHDGIPCNSLCRGMRKRRRR